MTTTIVLILCSFGVAISFSNFRDNIPNGYGVPNPCLDPAVWNPVGHYNPVHPTVAKNAFARDFKANNYTWTHALCMADSDGDLRTNGEELGDPECDWIKGGADPILKASGHPGICEPVGFHQCHNQHFDCDCLEQCHHLINYLPLHPQSSTVL